MDQNQQEYQQRVKQRLEDLDTVLKSIGDVQNVENKDNSQIIQEWLKSNLQPIIQLDSKNKFLLISQSQLDNFKTEIQSFKDKVYNIEEKYLKQYDESEQLGKENQWYVLRLQEQDQKMQAMEQKNQQEIQSKLSVMFQQYSEQLEVERKEKQLVVQEAQQVNQHYQMLQKENQSLKQEINNNQNQYKNQQIEQQHLQSNDLNKRNKQSFDPETYVKLKVKLENQELVIANLQEQVKNYENQKQNILGELDQNVDSQYKQLKQKINSQYTNLLEYKQFDLQNPQKSYNSPTLQLCILSEENALLQDNLENKEIQLQMERKEKDQKILKQKEEIEKLTVLKESLDQTIQAINEKLNNQLQKIDGQLFDYNKKEQFIQDLQQKIKDGEDQIESLEKEKESQRDMYESKIIEHEETIRILQPYQEKCEFLKLVRTQNRSQDLKIKTMHMKLKQQKNNFESQVKILQQTIQNLKLQIQILESENQLIKGFDKDSRQQKVLDHFKNKYKEVYTDFLLQQCQLKQKDDKLNYFEAQIKNMQSQIDNKDTFYQKAIKFDIIMKFASQCDEYQQKMNSVILQKSLLQDQLDLKESSQQQKNNLDNQPTQSFFKNIISSGQQQQKELEDKMKQQDPKQQKQKQDDGENNKVVIEEEKNQNSEQIFLSDESSDGIGNTSGEFGDNDSFLLQQSNNFEDLQEQFIEIAEKIQLASKLKNIEDDVNNPSINDFQQILQEQQQQLQNQFNNK